MRLRAASVYLHENCFHVHADAMTHTGVWVAAPPFRSCQDDIDDASLGDLILLAHHGSAASPAPRAGLLDAFAPLLAAAGVDSWEAFAATARSCGVATGQDAYVITCATGDSASHDFRRELRRPCRLADLGAAVRASLQETPKVSGPTASAIGSLATLPGIA